jgi:hypothetical protein
MNSSGTKPNGNGKPNGDNLKIDAVCLLPEPRSLTHRLDDARGGVEKKLEALMLAFGRRFTYPFFLTIGCGLVRIGEPLKASRDSYGDMPPEKRHVWLNAIRGELSLITSHGRPCLCLAGGFMTQGLRRLDIDFLLPLSCMSQRQRREWLTKRQGEPLEAVVAHLWRGPADGMIVARNDDVPSGTKPQIVLP